MLAYLLAFAGGFMALWVLRIFRRVYYQLSQNALATLNVMLSPEPEEEKLVALQNITGRLVVALFKGILGFILALGLAYGPTHLALILTWLSPDGYSNALWVGAVSVGASIPFFIPLPLKASGYTEVAQLFHRLILDNYFIGLRFLKREVKKQHPTPPRPFIIVSGLARSGTTSLMNALVQSPKVASLSYAHMPFLLSPQTWRRWYKPKGNAEKERSHKDGLKIGLQSNEALEEYFFKALLRDKYIEQGALKEHVISKKELAFYTQYQNLICNTDQHYLAKNNNFLLRYASVRKSLPNFVFALLFREPLPHAASLLAMHKRYKPLQQEDSFVLEYMNWLGHHEFGQNHKWFAFTKDRPKHQDLDSINYWLEVWVNYYQKALTAQHENTLFIAYHHFCQEPKKVLEAIGSKTGFKTSGLDPKPYENQRTANQTPQPKLLVRAQTIYAQLLKLATHGK